MNRSQRGTEIFHELAEHVSLTIHFCQEAVHDKNWTESKVHPHYNLWFIRSGNVHVQTGDVSACAEPGDIVFFYPFVPYTAETEKEGCRFIFTHFTFGIGDHANILADFHLTGIVPGKLVRKECLLFHDAFDSYARNDHVAGIKLKGCLTIVLAKMIAIYGREEYTGTFFNSRPKSESPQSARSLILQPVFGFIHDNIHRVIKILELAEIVSMSEKYFITYFKRAVGVTPGQYVNQVKMNKAREYICQKTYTIQEISSMLGYADPYTFSKAFKKYYKVPPSQFNDS